MGIIIKNKVIIMAIVMIMIKITKIKTIVTIKIQ